MMLFMMQSLMQHNLGGGVERLGDMFPRDINQDQYTQRSISLSNCDIVKINK